MYIRFRAYQCSYADLTIRVKFKSKKPTAKLKKAGKNEQRKAAMAVESSKTTIKRFTYDWLIRFAELHPIQSRHADISPWFGELLTKYHKLDVSTAECFAIIGNDYWEATGDIFIAKSSDDSVIEIREKNVSSVS
uniref:HTH CENPB-type domain-containing protein n=1 Tax=Panagrellus redivivus TaxID=6233 RepID=A0A7E4VMP1_PANRE